jgi:hypothetical protein
VGRCRGEENCSREAGENINFTNRTFTWRTLPKNATTQVKVHGAKWDGVSKDDRVKDRTNTETVAFALGKNTRKISVGATNACAMGLVYDVTWMERLVEG